MHRYFAIHVNKEPNLFFFLAFSSSGQKYAVMEEKVVLATVLRNFHLESLEKREDLILIGELVLRPRDGVQVRLTPKPITPSNCPSSC